MEYTISFAEDLNRFTLTTFDELSLDGIKEMMKELLTHASWQKGRDLLVDHRKASFEKITPEEMAYLAETVSTLDKTLGARHCAVISPDDGIAKHAMYEFEIDPRVELVTRTFLANQYDEALAWLGEKANVARSVG